MTFARHLHHVLARQARPAPQWPMPQLPFLLALIGLTVLAGLPLFELQAMSGHDSWAYLPRSVEFYEGLRDGQILPRWAPDLAFGYGEPTFNFNPPLLYYVTSFMHVVGFTFVASEDLAVFVLLLTAGLGMYLLAGSAFGRRGGLVAAVAYVFSPYLLVCLYVRHALANFSAFAFMPFAFYGLHYAVRRGSTLHLVIGALGVSAVMLSSLSVAIIVFPALLLLLVWDFCLERTPGALVRGVWCIALALGLSAFFWLPPLRETSFVHIDRREDGWRDFHNHFVYFRQLIDSPWGYEASVPGPKDGMSFAIGPMHLLLSAASILLLPAIWRATRSGGALLAAFLLFAVGAAYFTTRASLRFWEDIEALQTLQYTWRFLSLVSLATSFACGAPFVLSGRINGKIASAIMAVTIGLIFVLGFVHANPERLNAHSDADYSPEHIATAGLEASEREFEPIDVALSPSKTANEPLSVISGTAEISMTSRSVTERAFDVRVDRDAELRLNTFYFPGWTVYVDGKATQVRHDTSNGLMEFTVPPGQHTVKAVFQDTAVRFWSGRLSLAALALLLLTPMLQPLSARFAAVRNRRHEIGETAAREQPGGALP